MISERLDIIASELERVNPVWALLIDRASDRLDGRIAAIEVMKLLREVLSKLKPGKDWGKLEKSLSESLQDRDPEAFAKILGIRNGVRVYRFLWAVLELSKNDRYEDILRALKETVGLGTLTEKAVEKDNPREWLKFVLRDIDQGYSSVDKTFGSGVLEKIRINLGEDIPSTKIRPQRGKKFKLAPQYHSILH